MKAHILSELAQVDDLPHGVLATGMNISAILLSYVHGATDLHGEAARMARRRGHIHYRPQNLLLILFLGT